MEIFTVVVHFCVESIEYIKCYTRMLNKYLTSLNSTRILVGTHRIHISGFSTYKSFPTL